ncbi:hypothetical protein Tco_1027918 [Tanacetum coccineum]
MPSDVLDVQSNYHLVPWSISTYLVLVFEEVLGLLLLGWQSFLKYFAMKPNFSAFFILLSLFRITVLLSRSASDGGVIFIAVSTVVYSGTAEESSVAGTTGVMTIVGVYGPLRMHFWYETDIQEKDKKKAKNDKTEHGMEKTKSNRSQKSPHTTSTLGFLSLQRNTEESTAGRPKEEVFSINRAIVTQEKEG